MASISGIQIKAVVEYGATERITKHIQAIMMKQMQKNSKEAADAFRDAVKHEYINEPKAPVNQEFRKGQGGNALFLSGQLAESIQAVPDGYSKDGTSWVVKPAASVHDKGGLGGGRKATMQELAGLHEGGFSTILPKNGKEVSVQARPVWEPAMVKMKDRLIAILSKMPNNI